MPPKANKNLVRYRWLNAQTEVMIINHRGKIRILNSICPHMGARLECDLTNNKQHCPWHGLEFDLDTLSSSHPRYRTNKEFNTSEFNPDLENL